MSRIPSVDGILIRQRLVLHVQAAAETAIRYAVRTGIQGMVLDLGAIPNLTLLDETVRLKSVVDEITRHGLRTVVHGDFRQPLAATEPVVRQRAIDQTVRELGLAARLGGPLIIHPSPEPGPPIDRPRAQEAFAQAVEAVVERAHGPSAVVVENLPDAVPGARYESPLATAAEIAEFLSRCPATDLAFDIGHANIRQPDPVGQFQVVASRVRLLALNDNHGDLDAHLLPGSGNIDFLRLVSVVRELEWTGGLIVEVRKRGALHQHRAAWNRILGC